MDYTTLDTAYDMGRAYAEAGIREGDLSPEDTPLSGEWAGALTLDDILRDLGADPYNVDEFERDDVADRWEDGYLSASWPEPFVDSIN